MLGLLLPVLIAHTQAQGSGSLLGFSASGSSEEHLLESRFDGALRKEDLPIWMKEMSAKPHHVGSDYGLHNAEFARNLFASWGFDAKIEQFLVLFPEPKVRVLEMGDFQARLFEPPISQDSTSAAPGGLPPYNAYSCDGDVRGKLVYVNYGVPKDYEELDTEGVNVRGKIVIARYGGAWRGTKPKVAAEHGAIGCIIYSDPRDDGYSRGDVYPKGAFRNDSGVQRGSVADMPVYPGDPLTPGVGATEDAPRLAVKDAATITKIPTLPISYGDAQPLLADLQGPVAPDSWRGGLPITYHIGPSKSDVHLKVTFDWKMVHARDVIAKLPGADRPDEWVIRGNHHDAWVMGAEDPLSGAVSLLEEARAVGQLAKGGWRPKRTLVYCLWDGEEPGLLGSTEWVETHGAELATKGAIYVNSDTNGRGFLGMEGSHSVERLLNDVAREVPDPQTKFSVLDRARARSIATATGAVRAAIRSKRDVGIGALGSGSDYSPFIQHAGITSVNLGFGGEDGGGIYHSTYDSFDWYQRFGDPKWEYGITLARVAGRIVLRCANADVLPFEYTRVSDVVGKYIGEVMKLADDERTETEDQNRVIADGTLQASYDPTLGKLLPKAKDPVPFLDFSPLQNAYARLKSSAARYDPSATVTARDGGAVDKSLIEVERSELGPGLPRRPWYKHMLYAPGLYTGYGVKTLPGVREAIEQRNWKEAGEQIALLAQTLNRLSDAIDAAARQR